MMMFRVCTRIKINDLSPVRAKYYSPVWSEAECGICEVNNKLRFGGIFDFSTKIVTKLGGRIITQ